VTGSNYPTYHRFTENTEKDVLSLRLRIYSRKFGTATAVRDVYDISACYELAHFSWLSLIFGAAMLIQSKAVVRRLIAAGSRVGSFSVISDRHQFSRAGCSKLLELF
jgi:hypothetical protein